jgi:hypothetical protein
MNLKKTLLLAALLTAAVFYLVKVTLPQREQKAAEARAFAGIDESKLSSIDLNLRALDGSTESYSLDRGGVVPSDLNDNLDWSMRGTNGAVLDGNVVRELAKGVKDLVVEEAISDRELNPDLSVYGLDKPVLTVVANQTGGVSREVAFGKRNEYLSKRYAKVSGRSGVFLVADAAFAPLNKSRKEVRSNKPVRFNVADVREALLTSSQGRIKLSQPAVGEWKIIEPKELPASKDSVDEFMNALSGVTVSEFIDLNGVDLAQYGFKSPRANIHLQLREGLESNQIVFSLANANAKTDRPDDMYLQISGVDTLFKLASDPSASLVKRVNDLREKDILGLKVSEIDSIVSEGTRLTATTLATAGLVWTVDGKDTDPVFMEQYLNDLVALKAVDFPETVPADAFEPPFLKLTITNKGTEKKSTILIVGKEVAAGASDPLRYVKSSRSDTVYAIRDVEAKRLVPHEEVLVSKATPTPQVAGGAAK